MIHISQTDYVHIVEPRISFTENKNKATKPADYVVLNSIDTLYVTNNSISDLSFLNADLYSDPKSLIRYTELVFMFSDTSFDLKQWNTPINVYIDPILPKDVIKEFEEFFSKLKGIDNLKISFVNQIEDSNYYIRASTKEEKSKPKDTLYYKKEYKKNHFLTEGSYRIQTDKNYKNYSGILNINLENKDHNTLLKQMKQLFFMSLGQFTLDYDDPPGSLLSESYINSDHMSDSDYDLLKIHYAIIYDRRINGTTFNKLVELSKQKL